MIKSPRASPAGRRQAGDRKIRTRSSERRSGVDVAKEGLGALVLDLVDHLDAMVAYWDIRETCVFANQAYADWFGREGRDLIGIRLSDLLGPLYEKNRPHIEAAYRGEKQVFERAIPRPGGGVRHSLATYIPRVVHGRVVGMFVHVADVEPLKTLENALRIAKERAEFMARHDSLTGLPNRVALQDWTNKALAMARRTTGRASVLTIDVDNFKNINDALGHAEGDRFLKEFASRLSRCVRDSDIVSRIGGDEFVLVTLGGSIEEAKALGRRVLRASALPFDLGGTQVEASVSIGIASCPEHGSTLAALMRASDRALYVAKAAGRNRCAVATTPSLGGSQ